MNTIKKTIHPRLNARLTIATLPYEVRGSNQSLVTCRAASPFDAIDIFLVTCPNEEPYEIKRVGAEEQPESLFQIGETAVTRAGEHVVILRFQLINEAPHYETSLEAGAWFPEYELRAPQVVEAIAA